MNRMKFSEKTLKIIYIFSLGVFSYFVAASIIWPVHRLFYGYTLFFLTLIAGVIIFGGAVMYSLPFVQKMLLTLHNTFLRRVIIFGSIFIVHLGFAWILAGNMYDTPWDAGVVFRTAVVAASDTKSSTDLTPYDQDYFVTYPNNATIALILTAWFKLWGLLGIYNYTFLAIALNVLCMNIALWMTYAISRKMFGVRASLLTIVFGVLFITLSLWSRMYYSDTMGLPFPIAILWLTTLVRDVDQRKNVRSLIFLLLGVTIGFGYMVKPSVIIVAVALAIVYLIRLIGEPVIRIKPMTLSVCLIASGLLIGVIIPNKFATTYMGVNQSKAMPMSHFAMLGLSKVDCIDKTRICEYGIWNRRDLGYYSEYSPKGIDVYQHFTYEEIHRRISNYGLAGYATFLTQKGSWIISDGSFYAYKEGDFSVVPTQAKSHLGRIIYENFFMKGRYYDRTLYYIEIAWYALLGLIALQVLFVLSGKKILQELVVAQISIFGLLVFLLIFEARSRYLYLYLPFFILLATHGAQLVWGAAQTRLRISCDSPLASRRSLRLQ